MVTSTASRYIGLLVIISSLVVRYHNISRMLSHPSFKATAELEESVIFDVANLTNAIRTPSPTTIMITPSQENNNLTHLRTAAGLPAHLYLPTKPESYSWQQHHTEDDDTTRRRRRRPLNFLHIPKTGGSSIFMAAAYHGYNWADCMWPSDWVAMACHSPNTHNKLPTYQWKSQYNIGKGPWWHTPIQYLEDPTIYSPYDVFVVIRNPYERAVSEYYYHCKNIQEQCFGKYREKDTFRRLNRVIQKKVKIIRDAEKNTSNYYINWGHWIPQIDYIIYYNDTSQTERQMVEHVLRNEYLHEEFASLMEAYQLNIKLGVKKRRSRTQIGSAAANCTVADLNVRTMRLIEQVYAQDFAIGGYPMLSEIVINQMTQQNEDETDEILISQNRHERNHILGETKLETNVE